VPSVSWAKSSPAGYSPLWLHISDTGRIAKLYYEDQFSPNLKAQLDTAFDGHGREVVTFLAAVHDIGKCSVGFQLKDRALAARVFDVSKYSGIDPKGYRHELAGEVLLQQYLESKGFSRKEAESWAAVVGAHHGTPPTTTKLRDYSKGRKAKTLLYGARSELVQEQQYLLQYAEEVVQFNPATLKVTHRLLPGTLTADVLAAVVVCDWVASTEQYAPLLGKCEGQKTALTPTPEETALFTDPKALDSRAKTAYQRANLPERPDFSHSPEEYSKDLEGAFRRRCGYSPRPAQREVILKALETPKDNTPVFLYTAPMGSGKTEGALAAAEVLAGRFGRSGVVWALPTKATTNAMYARVRDFYTSALGERAQVTGQEPEPQGKERGPQDPTHLAQAESLKAAPRVFLGHEDNWLNTEYTENLTRSAYTKPRLKTLHHFDVCTIDQLLRATVVGKHVELAMRAFKEKVVVVDEVAALDEVSLSLLGALASWGCPVALLTAACPPPLYARLRGVFPALETVPSGPSARPCPPVLVRPRPGVETSSVRPCAPASVGGVVAVLRGTVGRAQATYKTLRERNPEGKTVLLHSRFTAEDRAEKEKYLLAALGKNPSDPEQPNPNRPEQLTVVATQVLEQSLDIDFDCMVTDVAPVEALLQRVGRLHRHRGNDPMRPRVFRTPRAVVEGYSFKEDSGEVDFGDLEWVYGKADLLDTLDSLEERSRRGSQTPASEFECASQDPASEPGCASQDPASEFECASQDPASEFECASQDPASEPGFTLTLPKDIAALLQETYTPDKGTLARRSRLPGYSEAHEENQCHDAELSERAAMCMLKPLAETDTLVNWFTEDTEAKVRDIVDTVQVLVLTKEEIHSLEQRLDTPLSYKEVKYYRGKLLRLPVKFNHAFAGIHGAAKTAERMRELHSSVNRLFESSGVLRGYPVICCSESVGAFDVTYDAEVGLVATRKGECCVE
jgi:CRISPR-associated endonuclease/helicase Cas3